MLNANVLLFEVIGRDIQWHYINKCGRAGILSDRRRSQFIDSPVTPVISSPRGVLVRTAAGGTG